MSERQARCYLYSPADRPDRLTKAVACGADAVIADLEDGVAVASKDAARSALAEWLRAGDWPCQVWVRVNNGPSLEDELRLAAVPGVTGVVLPKAASVEQLDVLDRRLAPGQRVALLVESAAGLLALPELARGPRVSHLMIGEADLGAELGCSSEEAFVPLRMQLVVASAAAGIAPPTGPVCTDVRDLSGLEQSTTALRGLGFRARSAIHPAQVPVIQAAFTPSAEQVARARRTVELFEAALAAGSGVCVDDDGRMVDEPIVRMARSVLAAARD